MGLVLNLHPANKEDSFQVRDMVVRGDVVLAPMAGYGDPPYRSLCRQLGSAMSYTVLMSARAILFGKPGYTRRLLFFEPHEKPVVFQLFDSDEDRLVEAARRIEEFGPDMIDVNMGCSVRRISGRGAGAGLLRDIGKVERIFRKLSRAVAVPVSGKIRLGWDNRSLNYLDTVRAMQDNGAALVAVHARTRDQGYSGKADWTAIQRIVEIARIPVIGNGDVKKAADIDRMKAQTGCAAVMVGRAAIGHPWIFQRLDRHQIPGCQKIRFVHRHFENMRLFYGEATALVLIRKHLTRYFNDFRNIRRLRPSLLQLDSLRELHRVLDLMGEPGKEFDPACCGE
jgi:tRNA-dihydrouridine synthase B